MLDLLGRELTDCSSRMVPLFDIDVAGQYAGLAHLAETSLNVRRTIV